MFFTRNDTSIAALIAVSALSLAACEKQGERPIAPPGSSYRVDPGEQDLNQFFECLEADGITLVAAHRGGDIENSFTGMSASLATAPAMMEVDVNVSSDGVLFLMHDDTLDRTTTGTGIAAEQPWSYISGLTIEGPDGEPYPETPPTLADALAWADGKTLLELDIKSAVRYEDLVDAVKSAGATDRIIYIAYTAGQARRLHQLHPQAMISAALDDAGELQELVASGIPADRLLGWTGNTAPNQIVFDELNDADVEVIFGTLGGSNSIDNQIERSGNTGYYVDLAKSGVDIIATDNAEAAYLAMRKAGLNTTSPACGVYDAE